MKRERNAWGILAILLLIVITAIILTGCEKDELPPEECECVIYYGF